MNASADVLLDVRDVVVTFGGIVALYGVSFAIQKGHIQGLIGPNGAGKTTLFNCLSRLYIPDSGERFGPLPSADSLQRLLLGQPKDMNALRV